MKVVLPAIEQIDSTPSWLSRLFSAIDFIGNLEDPLVPLPKGASLKDFNLERETESFGDQTQEIVGQLRKALELEDGHHLDYELATAINEKLFEHGQLRQISGQLIDEAFDETTPFEMKGLRVVASKDIHLDGGVSWAGHALTDEKGSFKLYFDWDDALERGRPLHIQLHVRGGRRISDQGLRWIA